MQREDRIFFPGNPWPGGHVIRDFKWSGRLDPATGVWFDFTLISNDYYAEDELHAEEEEDDTAEGWTSKAVWANYQHCTISSRDYRGILAGNAMHKFDWQTLADNPLKADTLPLPEDFDQDTDVAFSIYLLGHDDCAGHVMRFREAEYGTFQLQWEGAVALSYGGDFNFRYRFNALVQNAIFEGFRLPSDITDTELEGLLEKYMVDPAAWQRAGENPRLLEPA